MKDLITLIFTHINNEQVESVGTQVNNSYAHNQENMESEKNDILNRTKVQIIIFGKKWKGRIYDLRITIYDFVTVQIVNRISKIVNNL
jgi:hypothetical protein